MADTEQIALQLLFGFGGLVASLVLIMFFVARYATGMRALDDWRVVPPHKQLMAHLAEGSLNFLLFEVVFNTKIDPKKFKEYLDEKDLAISDGQLGDGSLLKSAIWDEDDESVWCVLQRPPA